MQVLKVGLLDQLPQVVVVVVVMIPQVVPQAVPQVVLTVPLTTETATAVFLVMVILSVVLRKGGCLQTVVMVAVPRRLLLLLPVVLL